jgi:outer membrane protein OmpU
MSYSPFFQEIHSNVRSKNSSQKHINIGGFLRPYGVAGSASSPEETAFDAGITYASGPWAVGVNYLNVAAPKSTAVQGDDESTQIFLGASYKIGPGIELLGNVFHVDWDDETTADANNNDGWGVLAGISVAF